MQPLFNIVLVRVDNRLVHGQLLEAWVPHLDADCIIIVDDEVMGDVFRETVIRMAVPREVEVIVSGVGEFAGSFQFTKGAGKNTIVLFCNIADAVRAFNLGFRFDKLNVGNVFSEQCALCCSRSVSLGRGDLDHIIGLLNDSGVTVELRGVPNDRPADFRQIIKMDAPLPMVI
ncbi:MAG: PTS sugar transporter subunit IIB [Smithellaceae bacterium]|nr:PTS sugar transporter subunit IIB [Smithellaceae bacterium]